MALPASGTITAQMIEDEFGGAHPISLNEYYRGGARVPNTPTNASVPTSGTISYNDFHGASALPPVALSNTTVSSVTTTGTATATYSLLNSGIVQGNRAPTGTYTIETWLNSGAASSYDVMATLSSGDTPTGSALSTWMNLGTTRSWTLTDVQSGAIGAKSCTLSIQIRPAGGGSTLATATIGLEADYSTV